MKKKTIILLIVLQFINPFAYREAHSASLYTGVKYDDIDGHWAKEAILDVIGSNYMVGKSSTKFGPRDNITNVESLTLILRILDFEKEAQITQPSDWTRGIYELAQAKGILEKSDGDGLSPNPSANTSRQEFFYYLGKAIYPEPALGDQIVKTRNFHDFSSIREEYIPYIESLYQDGYFNGDENGNFNPTRPISRGEVAQVISNKLDKIVGHRSIEAYVGQVTDVKLDSFLVYNQDGNSLVLNKINFPVQKDKTMYNEDALEEGSKIVYYRDSSGKPIYAKILQGEKTQHTGTIEIIDTANRKLSLYDFDGNRFLFELPESIDMSKFYFDQEVIVQLEGGQVSSITRISNLEPDQHGAIVPGTRFKKGNVLFVNAEEIEIQTATGREKYTIDPYYTSLYKKNQRAEVFQIKEGDRVLLTFDDIYSSDISEIKIEDEAKHIKGVLRSKISIVDERNKEILFKDNYSYQNGSWIKIDGDLKVKVGTGTIYDGSKKINLENLKKNIGRNAYIAYEEPYGKKSLGKMTLLSGSPMEYENTVADIDFGSGKITVSSTMMDFHEGSIVVKDNRLVDPLNLDIGQDIYLGTDYRLGERALGFASIEGTSPIDERIDDMNILVYKGKIEDIMEYKLTLGNNNYSDKMEIDHTGFKVNTKAEDFIFTEDTAILDQELGKYIPVKAFKDSRFIDLIDIKDRDIRDRVKSDFYKNKPAYLVAKTTPNGKEVLAISLVPQESRGESIRVDKEFATSGQISHIDIENGKLILNEARNYNGLTGKWERVESQSIDGNKALILVNDRPIKASEINKIRLNAKVYVLRQKDKSISSDYIIIVED